MSVKVWKCLRNRGVLGGVPGIYVGATCIGKTSVHQLKPLALVANLATTWRHFYCHIDKDCPGTQYIRMHRSNNRFHRLR